MNLKTSTTPKHYLFTFRRYKNWLKEIQNENKLSIHHQKIETPHYHTIKNNNDTYSRVYYTKKLEEKELNLAFEFYKEIRNKFRS